MKIKENSLLPTITKNNIKKKEKVIKDSTSLPHLRFPINKSLLRPLQNSHRETNKCILRQHHKQPSSRSSVQSEKHSVVNASHRKTLSSTPPSSVLLRPQSISKIHPPSSPTSFLNGPSPTILTVTAVATLFIIHSVNLPPLLLPFCLCPTQTTKHFSSMLLSTISS